MRRKTSSYKRRASRFIFPGIILCACVVSVIAAGIFPGRKEEPETFVYAALGDSIPNGYTASADDSVEGYPELLAEEIGAKEEIPPELLRWTKDGLTVGGLCETYLSDTKVQEGLNRAGLITVTVGANDLLKKYRELYREVFGDDISAKDLDTVADTMKKSASENPRLMAEAAKMMYRWDCSDFERDWKKAMEIIRENRREDGEVIVTTIYCPLMPEDGPELLDQMTEVMIGRMNGIITGNAEAYGYQTVDLSGIEEHLQSDGLHPDRQGQQMIMERIALGRERKR